MPETATSIHPASSHREFFRHSGWIMVATIVGGVLALGVHFLARKMSPAEYGLFGALMAVAICVPATPLQVAFARQTAQAIARGRERQLAGLVRVFCWGSLVLWLIFTGAVLLFKREILFRWEVSNPMGLYIMLPFLLLSLWTPVFSGILQGRQNFLWLGWSSLLSMGGRVAVAAVAVLALGAGAAGMMSGVLVGGLLAIGIALWQTSAIWLLPPEHSNWKEVLRDIFPLLVGVGAFQFLFGADMMFAKAYFGATDVGYYNSAGVLCRALMWAVGPLAVVMFPKIVHSHTRSEKSDLMRVVLAGTAILSVVGALGLVLVGPLMIRLVFAGDYVKPASLLLPWYAGAMIPLTLANVLLNNLLARGRHGVVPALVVVAGIYVLAMTQFHASMVQLLQAFGAVNLLLLAVCAGFTIKR